MRTRREIIGVLGSGKEEHRAWVEPLARWIAERGFHLLTGAGGGVMRAAAEAFVEVEGRVGLSLGIVPGAVVDGTWRPKPGYPNAGVEVPILTHLPLSGEQGTEPMSRNHLNVLTARALVALPGGTGTVSEAVLALRYGKPLILFGPGEAFGAFPTEVERTQSLERVCEFLLAVVR
ncbi:molybdenum cofactor carrier protein [Archangium sp.]|uniref:SLOG cluster 4 domain-containing protein n=1 Tax=Archangium sp. TaxID=1872627 RepID=UPI002D50F1C8|nr:molybdenum cofactor carrier protein [Archangium sp.]HYO57039.1 molybdenum cofactor carrier protein [Archangium sp.]